MNYKCRSKAGGPGPDSFMLQVCDIRGGGACHCACVCVCVCISMREVWFCPDWITFRNEAVNPKGLTLTWIRLFSCSIKFPEIHLTTFQQATPPHRLPARLQMQQKDLTSFFFLFFPLFSPISLSTESRVTPLFSCHLTSHTPMHTLKHTRLEAVEACLICRRHLAV